MGLLQPVVVRSLGGGRYELVMGERRWRASQRAGLEYIPAIVRETHDDDMLRDALLENLHRQQLDPLEEAAAYQQLLDDFGATHEQLAQKVGRSRPHISNTLRLLNLPPVVQKRVAAGVISAGHARALLSLDDAQAQERLAQRIVAEGLSVRAVEEIVAIGDDTPAKSPRKPAANKPVAPALRHLADRLSDLFDTRVKVELGRNKGKIVVEFASIDDLERIVKAMSPDDAATARRTEELTAQALQAGPPQRPTSTDASSSTVALARSRGSTSARYRTISARSAAVFPYGLPVRRRHPGKQHINRRTQQHNMLEQRIELPLVRLTPSHKKSAVLMPAEQRTHRAPRATPNPGTRLSR